MPCLRRTEFGFVFQFGQLVPELTCLENVALPLRLGGMKRRPAERIARTWLDRLAVGDTDDSTPGQVSGGQSQRVAMARALITEPSVVFADEPTGALDTLSGELVMRLLSETAKQTDAAVVLVTHEARVAAYSDREAAPVTVSLRGTTGNPDFVELVRNSVAPYSGQITVASSNEKRVSDEARMVDDVRNILLGGALSILLLAGVSLLVLAQEQVRERRRALGALSATGVPVRVIARSLLWQNGIPLLLGIVLATVTGIAVAALGRRLFWDGLYVDWSAVGLLAAAAIAMVLLVMASTMPSVRAAAKSENLRTE